MWVEGDFATEGRIVKENVVRGAPLSSWWVAFGVAAVGGALVAVACIDATLPLPKDPSSASKDSFIASYAQQHLNELTAIGPRVAGSYENEVAAVRVLVEAVRRIAREASPHNRVEVDVHTANGAFALTFMDGKC